MAELGQSVCLVESFLMMDRLLFHLAYGEKAKYLDHVLGNCMHLEACSACTSIIMRFCSESVDVWGRQSLGGEEGVRYITMHDTTICLLANSYMSCGDRVKCAYCRHNCLGRATISRTLGGVTSVAMLAHGRSRPFHSCHVCVVFRQPGNLLASRASMDDAFSFSNLSSTS